MSAEHVAQYLEQHRSALARHTGKDIDPAQWRRGYQLSLLDLMINRIAMYLMGHTFRHYAFMERVMNTLRHLLNIEKQHGGL